MRVFNVILLGILLVFTPLVVGASIYFYNRQVTPLFLSWIGVCKTVKCPVSPFAHNLPDFLWLFALLNALGLIWRENWNTYVSWSLFTFLGALGTELAQKTSLIPGTYDIWDMFSYSLAFILSLLIFHRLSNPHIPIHHV